jgi:hypothetical protein
VVAVVVAVVVVAVVVAALAACDWVAPVEAPVLPHPAIATEPAIAAASARIIVALLRTSQ